MLGLLRREGAILYYIHDTDNTMFQKPIRVLGRYGMKYFSSYMKPLREEIIKSNLTILFEIYLGRMLFISLALFIGIFAFITVMFSLFGIPLLIALLSAIIASVTSTFFVFTINYSYPFHLIKANMPMK